MTTPTDIHSCSYFCTRPGCVLAQRDEMRAELARLREQEPVAYCNGDALLSFKCGNELPLKLSETRDGFYKTPLYAAPPAQPALTQKDKEQAAFEDWLVSQCPSGDVESVQHQWLASSEYLDLQDDPPAQPAAQPVQPQGWQPIETAPKDGQEFVTANSMQGFVKELVSWNRIHGYWQSKGKSIHMQATHWMPLPARPGGAS